MKAPPAGHLSPVASGRRQKTSLPRGTGRCQRLPRRCALPWERCPRHEGGVSHPTATVIQLCTPRYKPLTLFDQRVHNRLAARCALGRVDSMTLLTTNPVHSVSRPSPNEGFQYVQSGYEGKRSRPTEAGLRGSTILRPPTPLCFFPKLTHKLCEISNLEKPH